MQNQDTGETTPLHIVALEARNVKRLRAVNITPSGEVVIIGGNNAQGKTSVLDSIEMALAGTKCQQPIRHGASNGKVTIDLGELVVTRTFTPGGGTLTVKGRDGNKFSSPQGVLDKLIGTIAFDPLEFTRMKPAEQLATLREVTGINTAMLDGARQSAYDERTNANRKVKEIEGQLAGMAHHSDAPKEEVNAAELNRQLAEANEKNAERSRFIETGKLLAADFQRAMDGVEEMDRKIAEMTAARDALKERATSMAAELNAARAKAADWPEIDTKALAAQLDGIAATNRKVLANLMRGDAIEALERWREKSEKLTAQIEDIDAKKREKLERAKYPVPGLALDDGGVLFNGVPFAQCSAAEQLRVSVAMGLAMNPRLRVLLIRDGSLLDDRSLATLAALAKDSDAQLWIERVGKGDECSVIIEDGEVEEIRENGSRGEDRENDPSSATGLSGKEQ